MVTTKKKTTKKAASPKTGWGGSKGWKPVEIIRKDRFVPENGWNEQFENVFAFAVSGVGHGAVEAVAGSGKTTALVELAYRYIEANPTHRVLAIAFNSSIRKELQARMPVNVVTHTTHSFNYKSVMKMWGDGRPVFELQGPKGFIAKNLAEAAIGYEKEKEDDREALCHAMSLSKTRLASNIEEVIEVMDQFGIESTLKREDFAKHVLWMMDQTKRNPAKSNESGKKYAISFDDQVWLPIVNDWEPAEKFDLVLVDETQDLSAARAEVARRALKPNGRMIIVGDRFQCVSSKSLIQTPDGSKLITDLNIGDQVLSYRNGYIVPQIIKNMALSSWTYGIKIVTESGKSITMSPNHKIWASEIEVHDDEFLVYLMYRKNMGFRVGITNKSRSKNNPYGARLSQESADKMWILHKIKDHEEALFYEEAISLKYSIPTAVFNATSRDINQVRVDKIFNTFGANGFKLLSEWNFDFNLPHIVGAGADRANKVRRVIRMSAHIKSKKYTSISLEWSGLEKGLIKYNPVRAKNTPSGLDRFIIRKCFNNYRQALKFAEELMNDSGAELSRKLSLPNAEPILLLNASQLHTSMKVPVLDGEVIKLESIISIDRIEDSFIDLDVDDASNFFSDSILSHNSIYSFAGADIHALPNMTKELNATQLPLTCSFRCAKAIVKEAQSINPKIDHHPSAPTGIVDIITPDDIILQAASGDAVVSRTNAILVKVFFKLAKAGKKVTMLGRDYGVQLSLRVNSWAKKAKKKGEVFTGKDLLAKNDEWLDEQVAYMKKKKLSPDRIFDEHETIVNFCEDLPCKLNTVEATKEVISRINNMFSKDEEPGSDDGKNCITLSSTHKFKGLERNRVFLMRDTYRPDSGEDESNMLYVGITRAKNHLSYVRGKFKS